MKTTTLLLTLTTTALAHFGIEYPEMRGDSHAEGADQYIFPCANITSENSNRTLWPLSGGALSMKLGHDWTYYAINLGVGDEVSSFNVSLTPELHNATGKGTLCLDKVAIPEGLVKVAIPEGLVKEGQNASIQVVTFGASGSALYNCADITFSSKATDPSEEQCKTDGVTVEVVNQESANATSEGSGTTTTTTTTAETTGATGAAVSIFGSLSIVGGAAAIFAAGMGAF